MTENFHELIERIKKAHDDELKAVIALFAIEDPVARFNALDRNTSKAIAWAIPRAKQITIEEMKATKSFEEIGKLLGLSRQRVHQLANPDPRKATNDRRSASGGGDGSPLRPS